MTAKACNCFVSLQNPRHDHCSREGVPTPANVRQSKSLKPPSPLLIWLYSVGTMGVFKWIADYQVAVFGIVHVVLVSFILWWLWKRRRSAMKYSSLKSTEPIDTTALILPVYVKILYVQLIESFFSLTG